MRVPVHFGMRSTPEQNSNLLREQCERYFIIEQRQLNQAVWPGTQVLEGSFHLEASLQTSDLFI